MADKVDTRTREPEQPMGFYEQVLNTYQQLRDEVSLGAVVLRSKDEPWEQARQGRLRFFSHFAKWNKLAAPGWMVFEQDIRRHSGKHVHQGGLVIFVMDGVGYSVVDGVRYDWKKGDLIVLPIKPGGCEHQHFNLKEGEPCHWMAFVFRPFEERLGNQFQQREISSEWQPA